LIILRVYLIVAFCLLNISSKAQSDEVYLSSAVDPIKVIDSIKLKRNQSTNEALKAYLDDLILDNFLEAAVDSIFTDTLNKPYRQIALFHKGPQYSFEKLTFDTTNLNLFKSWNVDPPSNAIQFLNLRNKITQYYADNGYPFAKLYLKNLSLSKNEVEGSLILNKGKRILIDSFKIHGNLKIRKAYLEKYLDLDEGQLYDHSKVKKIGLLLDKLTFLKQEKDPDLSFFYESSTINLYLSNKNSSRFDLLFGLIPTNAIEGRQLFLSLDFTAELLNKLGYGEYLFVNFERLRPEQQKFEFKFNYPYILNLPYAIDFDFSIFRNSLDYQTLKSNLGIQYIVDSDIRIKVGWDVETSNIVEIDSTQLVNSKMLPEDLDVSNSGISIEAQINKLDYRFNPRRGYSFYFQGVAGRKKISRNTLILNLSNDDINFEELYSELKQNSFRYEIESEFSFFLPLANRGAFGFQLSSGWRFSDSKLFRNEKFQLGGNQLLRGFDEATFFTSYYAISTFEYRLLLSNNSYFSVPFIDIGVIENPENDALSNDSTLAIGIGSSLGIETKAGLFNFSIAVGRTSELGFDFKRPKAHFGFVSLF